MCSFALEIMMRESPLCAAQNWWLIYGPAPVDILSILCPAFTGKENPFTCSCYNNTAFFLSLC